MFKFFSKKVIQQVEQQNIFFTVDTQNLVLLYSFIEKKSGIQLDKNKSIIEQKIISFCKENNINSFTLLLETIKTNEVFFKKFVTLITINETYFFREKEQIQDAFSIHIKQNRSHFDILSLPSSSGEEIYSIIITVLEMKIDNFQVMGVDIDQEVIQKAKEGLYNKRAIHRVDKNILEKYFTLQNNHYQIKESVKKHAMFTQCNLFEDAISHIGNFDIIFSRNMFIYFNDEKKILAYKQLQKLKKYNDTKIYLGHADISSSLDNYIRSQK